MIPLCCETLATPLGPVAVGATERGLAYCGFLRGSDGGPMRWGGVSFRPVAAAGECDDAILQLREYFAGTRRRFELAFDLRGTEFQVAVWEAMLAIGFGETRTYGQLAAAIGRPSASRAVGAACGRNPVGIIIPCHRVVGADGSLTGYAGGLDHKQALLQHERETAGLAALRLPGL